MNARTLFSFVALGLPFVAIACGGTVEGVSKPSPNPSVDSGVPVSECTGVGPGCAGGESPGEDCTVQEECVSGRWQCNIICADPPPPPSGCEDDVIDCGGGTTNCWASPLCVNGNWTCVETCEAGTPSGDAGAPYDGGPICSCPIGDDNCVCGVDAGPSPPADAGCDCPPNSNGCFCASSG